MIVLGVIILIVILVVANAASYIFNKFCPAINNADEYFKAARDVSMSRIESLNSIPSQRVPITPHFVHSKTAMSYIDVINSKSDDGYDLEKNINQSAKTGTGSIRSQDKSDKIDKALDLLYQTNPQVTDANQKSLSDFNGTHTSIFETAFEGLAAGNKTKLQAGDNSVSRTSERDGYQAR